MTEKIATTTEPADTAAPTTQDEVLTEDVLVEEVSIDGMCGVY
jgi:mycofactocin precursor